MPRQPMNRSRKRGRTQAEALGAGSRLAVLASLLRQRLSCIRRSGGRHPSRRRELGCTRILGCFIGPRRAVPRSGLRPTWRRQASGAQGTYVQLHGAWPSHLLALPDPHCSQSTGLCVPAATVAWDRCPVSAASADEVATLQDSGELCSLPNDCAEFLKFKSKHTQLRSGWFCQ